MQEIESTKHQAIDLQAQQQIKQESIDSLIVNQTNQLNNQLNNLPQHPDPNTCQSTSKKSDNRFQASLERQRNLLLNMEQQLAIYPLNNLASNVGSNSLSNEPEDDDKVMDYQVDSNNNSMPILLNCNKQSLPSINELKRINRSTSNFNQNGQFTSQYTNDQTNQLNDDNEFSRFVEDDYSRLSHTNASLYDNYDLNQSIKIEDAFQDDKLDFKSGPTLAELNLNDDDMMDNLPTVNPNSVLCPSMPLQANKNGFLMGINYTTIGLTSNTSSLTTTITTADSQSANNRSDLVSSSKYNLTDDQFSLNNNQFEQINGSNFNQSSNSNRHLNCNSSTNNKGSIKQEFLESGCNARTANLSTNVFDQQQQTKSTGKTSYNTRTRGRNKSQSDKQSTRRTNPNNNQQQQPNLSANNQVLCKLLNEKNDNLNNILLINNNETAGLVNSAISNGQSIPSTTRSAANLINSTQFQAICVSSLTNSSSITNTQLTNKAISQLLPNDLLLNPTLNQQPIKCGLANSSNLRINNSTTRNRNSSISTEHSFSSSHDEGFISQAEEDSDEKDLIDDNRMVCDLKVPGNKQLAKTKRKRARKDVDKDQQNSNLIDQETTANTSINRNLKKIKLEDNQIKPSASGFASTLSTVKEERFPIIANKKDEKIVSKGRVNYKITKDKPILSDIQQQFKFDSTKLELSKPLINDEKMDGDSSDEDDDSFYGDYESSDLIGATTSDDQLNKWSLNMGRSRKNSAQRYFWQYNVQSKGPKGTKLTTMDNSLEGGELPCTTAGSDLEPLDPVFSPNCQIEGVKHAGKARRGDGNDLTASPRKLLMIGLELKKLSKIINDLTPVAEVPVNNKSNSRKEKNKLASRACRLKKKAQHEANKIKLHGLTAEYKKYALIISEFKKIQEKVCENPAKFVNADKRMIDQLNELIKEKSPIISIAGQTTEFVNSVLDSVSAGNISGGLEKL